MNLWPDDFDCKEKTPFEVLNAQSVEFDRKADNGISLLGNQLEYLEFGIFPFDTTKSAISLLKITHHEGYPCRVHYDGTIKRCRTEAELIGALAAVLNSQKVKMAISELMK
jgi:hypothetical protein